MNADEAWMLVVARRVARGELLYRDVFYGTGPTPVWLMVIARRIAGSQVWVLRLICAVSTAAVASCVLVVGDRGNLGTGVVVVLIATEVALCSLGGVDSLYVSVTKATAIGSVICVSASDSAPSTLAAGCLVGLALSSKYTIGIVAAFGDALLVLAMAGSNVAKVQRLGLFFGSAVLVVVAMVSPIAARRGIGAMIFRLGRAKASFVRHGTMGLRRGFAERRESTPRNNSRVTSSKLTSFAGHFESSVFASVLVIPLLMTTLLAKFGSLDARDVELVVLALIWIAVVAPRADFTHVLSGFALAATVAMLALERAGETDLLSAQWPKRGQWLVAIWLGLIVLVRVGAIVWLSPRHAARFAPSCRCIPFSATDPASIATFAKTVDETSNGRCFILGRDAPVLWLITDLANPTPYDYPLASTFGPFGEGEVASMLSSGSLPIVGVCGSIDGPNQPATILAALGEKYSVDSVSVPPKVRTARFRPMVTQAAGLGAEGSGV